MSMHQGIDLSRFKKISSDAKTSTLRHSKGHEIKIAHAALSPKMFEQLKGMPVHLAEGDEVVAPQPPVAEPIEQADMQEAPAPVAAPGPAPFPMAPAVAPMPQAPQQTFGVSPQDKMAEHMNFAADMAAGHVTPKTYSDLFAQKDTLPKIGTLFGLLLSGAGSGLAHQPNMVMEMMNKQIDRDLEAQKMDKENGRNFLALQYQHNLQQAQGAEHQQNVLNHQIEGLPKAAAASQYLQSTGVPNNLTNDYIKKSQEIWTPFEAKAKMLEAAGHHLDSITMNNPQANAMVKNQVLPIVKNEVAKTLAKGALATKLGTQSSGRQSVVNEDKLGAAIRLGQASPPGLPIQPGAINPRDVDAVQKEKGDLTMNRNGATDWNDSFEKIANMKHAGELPGVSEAAAGVGTAIGGLFGPIGAGVGGTLSHTIGKVTQGSFERERSIQKEALMQRIGKDMSSEDRKALVESLLPKWNDTKESMDEAHRKGLQHFQSLEKTPTLDTYANQIPGLKAPFPHLTYKIKEEKKQPAKEEKKASAKSQSKSEPEKEKKSEKPKTFYNGMYGR